MARRSQHTRVRRTPGTGRGNHAHTGLHLRPDASGHVPLWGRIPESCDNVEQLTEKILHEARVFITPGFIFGSNGNRYIRISLCAKKEKIAEALERIRKYFKHQKALN